MKYAVIKVVNGSFTIHSEGFESIESAKVDFHGLCQTLWNAPDVITAEVMIVDEQLDVVEGYKEYIHHNVYVPPVPEEEETEGEEEA